MAIRKISEIEELMDRAPLYRVKDLIGEDIIIYDIENTETRYGPALVAHFSFMDSDKRGRFITSAVVLSRKLQYLKDKRLLPVSGCIVYNDKYYDIM